MINEGQMSETAGRRIARTFITEIGSSKILETSPEDSEPLKELKELLNKITNYGTFDSKCETYLPPLMTILKRLKIAFFDDEVMTCFKNIVQSVRLNYQKVKDGDEFMKLHNRNIATNYQSDLIERMKIYDDFFNAVLLFQIPHIETQA